MALRKDNIIAIIMDKRVDHKIILNAIVIL